MFFPRGVSEIVVKLLFRISFSISFHLAVNRELKLIKILFHARCWRLEEKARDRAGFASEYPVSE